MYDFITIPDTNIKVSIFSNLGKYLIRNYIHKINKIKKYLYLPEKYLEGLTPKEKEKRIKRIKEGTKSDPKDPRSYRKFKTDYRKGKRIQTKPSQYTRQWKQYFPNANSLTQKSDLTGIPLGIIRKVYNKGLAAWRTGHRPGANPQQWGYARVHSFLVKGKTFYTSDNKLAKEAMKNSKAKKWFESIDGVCNLKKNKNKKWCKK